MKISNQHSNNLSKEINQVDESKQEEKPKKVGFWKRIFGSNADE